MMEIPNVTLPASTYSGSPTEVPKHLPASLAKSKMEVMELSDLHHPNCKINRKVHHTTSSSSGAGGGEGMGDRRGSESSDSVLLSPEASKATEAVEFIAEHLRNEDLYIQVRILAISHLSQYTHCKKLDYTFYVHTLYALNAKELLDLRN